MARPPGPGVLRTCGKSQHYAGPLPRGEGHTAFVHEEKGFRFIFGEEYPAWGRVPRLRSWGRDFVTFGEAAMESGPNAPYCIGRMQPSESCPFRRSWLRRQPQEDDMPAPVGGIPVNPPSAHRCQECRLSSGKTRYTVLTVPPLKNGLGYHGTSISADAGLRGELPPDELAQYTEGAQAILDALQQEIAPPNSVDTRITTCGQATRHGARLRQHLRPVITSDTINP
jgi:hypothetical protein